ncbi:MAG: acyltransferase family protein [Isosphaeraceae bacterium]
MKPTEGGSSRIGSLDQFRGYTVAGMLLVNFLGGYPTVPAVLRHHNTYCSYADTIMPQFFFAVGFAYRLTWLKRGTTEGRFAAYAHAAWRCLGLILLGVLVYHLDGNYKTWDSLAAERWPDLIWKSIQKSPFQALVHIGVTSLWILPVIGARPSIRHAFLLASTALHLAASRAGYLEFAVNRPVIDGGPLGFLSWTIPTLAGAWAYDVYRDKGPIGGLPRWLIGAAALMAIGYGMSLLGEHHSPPFLKPDFTPKDVDLGTMSQRTGSVSYQTFAAGFSIAIFALFAAACDAGNLRIGLFRTLGSNALAAYLLHMIVDGALKPFVPRDAPLPYILAASMLSIGLVYLLVRSLEKRSIYIRL